MALRDLRARAAEQPLAEFLGGRFGVGVELYRSISQDTPDFTKYVQNDVHRMADVVKKIGKVQ